MPTRENLGRADPLPGQTHLDRPDSEASARKRRAYEGPETAGDFASQGLPPTKLPRFFLVREAAEKALVSEWTIRNEIKGGRLRARRIGRLVRVLDSDLGAWMRGEAG